MSETFEPLSPEPQPLSQRWGLVARYGFERPIATPISEPGIGHCAALGLRIAEDLERATTFELQSCFGNTEGKIFAGGAPETATENSHVGFQAGIGSSRRFKALFSQSGNFVGALNWNVTPLIGAGETTVANEGYEGAESRTFDIPTNYALLGELRPGRRSVVRIGPAFSQSVRYAGDGSELNRVSLSLLLLAEVGLGDAADGSPASDQEASGLEIVQGIYALGHRFATRYLMNSVLADQQEEFAPWSEALGGDGERGALELMPLLEGGSALLGGMDTSMSTALHAGTGWFAGFTAARAGGGVGFLFSGDEAGRAGGVSDLLISARQLAFWPAGIESPGSRRGHPREEALHREAAVNLAGAALNAGTLLLGAGLSSGYAMAGAAGANIQLALMPDPAEIGLVERTDVVAVPISVGWGWGGARGGSRSGVMIHKSWRDFPTRSVQMFSSASISSPLFTDREQNTDVDSAVGLEWKTAHTRLALGLDTKAVFGGGEAAKAGIGGLVGLDIIIPLNGREDGSGIVIGARAMCHKIFPEGSQCEIAPHIGASIGF